MFGNYIIRGSDVRMMFHELKETRYFNVVKISDTITDLNGNTLRNYPLYVVRPLPVQLLRGPSEERDMYE
jgi:hypothetical protein